MTAAPITRWLLPLSLLPAIASAQPHTLELFVNPGHVYAGYTVTMRINLEFSGSKGAHVFFKRMTAGHPSITVEPYCSWANPGCWKTEGKVGMWNEAKNTSFDVKVTPAPDTPPGPYKVLIETTAGGIDRAISIPLRVSPPPKQPPRAARPAKVPNLPGLGRWRSQMTEVGDLFCDPKARYGFGNERDVWYYDGAWVFFQVYDYTKKEKWKACALNVASQYRDYVMVTAQPPGAIPPWRVFTQGLRRAYKETGDASYRNAVQALAGNSPFANSNGAPEDTAIRETAYLLRAYTDAHLLGIRIDPARPRMAADYLIGMADTLFAGPPQTTRPQIHQAFFDGLLAEALIYYYDNWVRDPRVPPAIKRLCDWIYEYLWDPKNHALIYNPFPENRGYPRHCEDMCRAQERSLINLVVPAYFWYWNLTGDDAMRRKGDEMFAHALDDPIDDKGKSYSVNYKWSFDGVRWRLGQ